MIGRISLEREGQPEKGEVSWKGEILVSRLVSRQKWTACNGPHAYSVDESGRPAMGLSLSQSRATKGKRHTLEKENRWVSRLVSDSAWLLAWHKRETLLSDRGNFLIKHCKTNFERCGPSNPESFCNYIITISNKNSKCFPPSLQ